MVEGRRRVTRPGRDEQGLRVSKVRREGEDNRRRDGNWSPATSWEGWFSEGTAGGGPIIFGFSRGGHYFWSAARRNLNSGSARNSVWPSWKWAKSQGYLGENYTRERDGQIVDFSWHCWRRNEAMLGNSASAVGGCSLSNTFVVIPEHTDGKNAVSKKANCRECCLQLIVLSFSKNIRLTWELFKFCNIFWTDSVKTVLFLA